MKSKRRIDMILQHPLFMKAMKIIEEAEVDRIYCRHGLEHSLDVARICYILCLENEIMLKKDVIYAAALLHDIGRCREYTDGESHDEAGAKLAREILGECEFSDAETEDICLAIVCHKRVEKFKRENLLGDALQKADKFSRRCFECKAIDSCYWPDSMKNKTIIL